MIKIGIIKTSYKENEKRVPIHPTHLSRIPDSIRSNLFIERAYGEEFGYADDFVGRNCAGMLERNEIVDQCDLLILPKPVEEDLKAMRSRQILWGWVHCVQQRQIAQLAIEKRLTLIAWESMHQWSQSGEKLMHIFYKNNELAGYAAVIHLLQLLAIDGHYGPRKRVAILGYGSVSRGAIYALQGRGFNNIHVYTKRPSYLVADQNPDVYYNHYFEDGSGQICAQLQDGVTTPLIDELAKADIICNGILQDTDNPIIFVDDKSIKMLKDGTVIMDISCDEKMGFSFAKPTSFEDPIIKLERRIIYYSVDHTPTYLWNAASREISKAVLPFMSCVIEGPLAWAKNETIRRAIEIQEGIIKNEKILSFQKRLKEYPHQYKTDL
jgi:alanine dehydrogenase